MGGVGPQKLANRVANGVTGRAEREIGTLRLGGNAGTTDNQSFGMEFVDQACLLMVSKYSPTDHASVISSHCIKR